MRSLGLLLAKVKELGWTDVAELFESEDQNNISIHTGPMPEIKIIPVIINKTKAAITKFSIFLFATIFLIVTISHQVI